MVMEKVSRPNAGGGRDYTFLTGKKAKEVAQSGSSDWSFDKNKELEQLRQQRERQVQANEQYSSQLDVANQMLINRAYEIEARKAQQPTSRPPANPTIGPLRSSLPQGPQSSQLTQQQKQQYGLFQSSGPVASVDPRTGRPYGTITSASLQQSKAMKGSAWQGPKDFWAGLWLNKPPEDVKGKEYYMLGASAAAVLPFDEVFKGYKAGKLVVGSAVTKGISKAGSIGKAVTSSRYYPWARTGTQAIVEGELAITGLKAGAEKWTAHTSPQDARAARNKLGDDYRQAFAEAIQQSEARLPSKSIGPVSVPSSAGGLVYGANRFVGEKIFKVTVPKESFRGEFEAALKRRGITPLPGLLDYAEKERGSKVFGELGAAVTIESITDNAALGGIRAGSQWVKTKAADNIIKKTAQQTIIKKTAQQTIIKKTAQQTDRQFFKSVGKEAFRRQMPVVLTASAAEGFLQYRADQKMFDQKFNPIAAGASGAFGGVSGTVAQRFITVPSIDPKTRWQSKAARGVVEVFEMGQELSGDLLADARARFMRTVTRKADFEPNVRIKPGKVSTATFSLQPAQPGISIPGISGKRFSVTGPGGFRLPSIGNIFKPGGRGPGVTTPSTGGKTPTTSDTTSDSGGKSGTPQSIFNGGPSVISSSTSSTSNAFSATSAFSISPSMSQFAPKIPPPVPIGLPSFKGGTQKRRGRKYVDELDLAMRNLRGNLRLGFNQATRRKRRR